MLHWDNVSKICRQILKTPSLFRSVHFLLEMDVFYNLCICWFVFSPRRFKSCFILRLKPCVKLKVLLPQKTLVKCHIFLFFAQSPHHKEMCKQEEVKVETEEDTSKNTTDVHKVRYLKTSNERFLNQSIFEKFVMRFYCFSTINCTVIYLQHMENKQNCIWGRSRIKAPDSGPVGRTRCLHTAGIFPQEQVNDTVVIVV